MLTIQNKFLALISTLTLSAPGLALSAPTPAAAAPSKGDILIVTPRDGHVPFTDAIDNAKTQIQMVMFHLSERSVTDSLKAAAKRGVDMQIILDRETATRSATATAIVSDLKAAGAKVELSSAAFSITHEKSMLVDGKTLFITSMNMTTIFDRTRDFGIITTDKAEVAEYKSFFDTDWSNAQTGSGTTPPDATSLVWSPTSSTARLTGLIGEATKSIDLMVENLGSNDIQTSLQAAAKKGVKIRVLVPACVEGETPNRNEPFLDQMMAEGIDARVMAGPPTSTLPYTHAKMIVIDQKKFYVGSENFSFNSLTKAREVGIIRDNASLAKDIEQIFESDFTISQARKSAQVWSCGAQVF